MTKKELIKHILKTEIDSIKKNELESVVIYNCGNVLIGRKKDTSLNEDIKNYLIDKNVLITNDSKIKSYLELVVSFNEFIRNIDLTNDLEIVKDTEKFIKKEMKELLKYGNKLSKEEKIINTIDVLYENLYSFSDSFKKFIQKIEDKFMFLKNEKEDFKKEVPDYLFDRGI